jgi:hypothetical protein
VSALIRLLSTVAVAATALAVASPSASARIELTDALGAFPSSIPDSKAWFADTCDLASSTTEVGVAPSVADSCLDWGQFASSGPSPNTPSPWATAPTWWLSSVAAAGAHPDATASLMFDVFTDGADSPVGLARNVLVDLPPGVAGNPAAVEQCTLEQFGTSPSECPPASQVGVSRLRLYVALSSSNSNYVYPVYNLEPRAGFTAEFGIPDIATGAGDSVGVSIRIFAKARTDGDFGVTTGVMQIPTQFPLVGQSLTFWGVPWAASHDLWRPKEGGTFGNPGCGDGNSGKIPDAGLSPSCQGHYDPSWGPIRPFFANPTECDGQKPVTWAQIDSYQEIGALIPNGSALPDGVRDPSDPNWNVQGSEAAEVSECAKPPFDPSLDVEPTTNAADAPSGIGVDVDLPQNDDPDPAVASNPDDATGAPAYWKSDAGRASAQLDKTVVTLPEGMSVNPSSALDLRGCTDAEMGVKQQGNPPLFDNSDPLDGQGDDCPPGSVIGTVKVETPLLEQPLDGHLILGQPKLEDLGQALPGLPRHAQPLTTRVFILAKSPERGLIAKISGTGTADPVTGRLTTTFDNNPRVPVEHVRVDVKGGPAGILATAQRCGAHAFSTLFSPWTAAHGAGGVDVTDPGAVTLNSNCAFGHAPKLVAGMSSPVSRGGGTFAFHLSRQDGQQWFKGLSAELPAGLLASVRGVPLCTSAQAANESCPEASRIGSVDAAAGSGTPYVLERKGDAYLTEGYKGAPYGLLVKVPVEAGPFRGDLALDPVVVRQAVHVDRRTAQVTAVSDPFPHIWHGIPLRMRDVVVRVDRANFMLNPSDCSRKATTAAVTSTEGAVATASSPFQATNCARLGFKPKLALRLTGKRQSRTNGHPGVRAAVKQTPGEAGIERAQVRLPKSLALDPDNAQALCEFDQGTKPDLENHCPKGSIVGRARAVSPLLNRPLVGNVYFVKNVRRSAQGNLIRTLPMIIVALRGEIAVNLFGESSTTKNGRLVNTFANVPDAPISRFNLNIKGGRQGILVVTRGRRGKRLSICGRQVAEADMDGQNGRHFDRNIRIKTPCKKKKKRNAARKKLSRRR